MRAGPVAGRRHRRVGEARIPRVGVEGKLNGYDCIYCGARHTRESVEPGCDCATSREVTETWAARDLGELRTYEVRYPHRVDPVRYGVHGNGSRSEDRLVGDRWADEPADLGCEGVIVDARDAHSDQLTAADHPRLGRPEHGAHGIWWYASPGARPLHRNGIGGHAVAVESHVDDETILAVCGHDAAAILAALAKLGDRRGEGVALIVPPLEIPPANTTVLLPGGGVLVGHPGPR